MSDYQDFMSNIHEAKKASMDKSYIDDLALKVIQEVNRRWRVPQEELEHAYEPEKQDGQDAPC